MRLKEYVPVLFDRLACSLRGIVLMNVMSDINGSIGIMMVHYIDHRRGCAVQVIGVCTSELIRGGRRGRERVRVCELCMCMH